LYKKVIPGKPKENQKKTKRKTGNEKYRFHPVICTELRVAERKQMAWIPSASGVLKVVSLARAAGDRRYSAVGNYNDHIFKVK
jgi:hypothetical protein